MSASHPYDPPARAHSAAVQRLASKTPIVLERFASKYRRNFLQWEKEGTFDSRCQFLVLLADPISAFGSYPLGSKVAIDMM